MNFLKEKNKIIKIIISALIFLSLLISCAQVKDAADDKQRYEQFFLGPFDTVTNLVAYTKDEESFRDLEQLVSQDLEHYHQLFDFFASHPGVNNIKSINDNAGKGAVKVDPDLLDFLYQCKWANQISKGRVNLAFGAVLSIWHSYRQEGLEDPKKARLPDLELLQEANLHTNIDDLILDSDQSSAYLKDPLASLDAGSGAKGYACELVAMHALAQGFDSFVISIGGNVRAVGKKPDGSKWQIGVKNPDLTSDEKILAVLAVEDLALVTSGVYERYYTVDDKAYHHIIDPDSLYPSLYFDSVTLIAPSSKTADALTTALMNMSYEEGLELIKEIDGCEALWIKDNKRYYSPGYDKYLAAD